MKEDYEKTYKNLISDFMKQIPDDLPYGIPCPMIPCVGDLYDNANFRIAFFGMETHGWGDLSELKKNYGNNTTKIFNELTADFKDLAFLDWTNNFHTSFWDYVLTFLLKFYKIKNKNAFQEDETFQMILRSFIWGNTHSLERYEISAKQENVDEKKWLKVKSASEIFDSAKYILDSCSPNVLIITDWEQSESWLLDNKQVNHKELDDHIWYFYLADSDTHVYWIAHPNWLARNYKFESSIDIIISNLKKKNIEANYDNVFKDNETEIIESNSFIQKYEYIGKLAIFLSSMKMFMSGMELANHLNRNGFKTSYNSEYVGTRGTYTLIRNCYHYFEEGNNKNIADAIATAFVKENGSYAYE